MLARRGNRLIYTRHGSAWEPGTETYSHHSPDFFLSSIINFRNA